MQELINSASLELWYMFAFIFSYATTSINTSSFKPLIYANSIVYSFSGLLFIHYIFDLKFFKDYADYFWVVAFLSAITFQQLLPSIMQFVVNVVSAKLNSIESKITKKDNNAQ